MSEYRSRHMARMIKRDEARLDMPARSKRGARRLRQDPPRSICDDVDPASWPGHVVSISADLASEKLGMFSRFVRLRGAPVVPRIHAGLPF